jgi:hypothetical protein
MLDSGPSRLIRLFAVIPDLGDSPFPEHSTSPYDQADDRG